MNREQILDVTEIAFGDRDFGPPRVCNEQIRACHGVVLPLGLPWMLRQSANIILHSVGSSLLIHAGGSLAGNESSDARFTTSSARPTPSLRGKSRPLVSRARAALGSTFEGRVPIDTPLVTFLSFHSHDASERCSLESEMINHVQDG
jgi:hypothetical protein